MEIVTRGERGWSYPPEEKARLLAETVEPGAQVLKVAQRQGLSPSLLHRWRREAEGRPPRKVARRVPRLVPLLVGAPSAYRRHARQRKAATPADCTRVSLTTPCRGQRLSGPKFSEPQLQSAFKPVRQIAHCDPATQAGRPAFE